jgi:hypothetical protein
MSIWTNARVLQTMRARQAEQFWQISHIISGFCIEYVPSCSGHIESVVAAKGITVGSN